MSTSPFVAEKVSQTASFVIEENIETVFPLFDAFEERKWEKSWNPKLIYPETEVIEVGTTFSVDGHGEEDSYLWRVIQFDKASNLIQYFVSTAHRDWTITVSCESIAEDKHTKATVTYTYIGLTPKGNELNRHHIKRMYQHDLQDWKQAIDAYLESLG
ncbi:hypothetical protein [Reichenbachiella sp.]|uniref:hypothetical protein n=1 Tax=Reichenbachiella sp. TaxID=2184521 RepID=UPI003B5A414E